METQTTSKSHRMLFLNTFAFTICFSVWVLNGVLVAFLVENQIFNWSRVEIGWLLGIPVLTGAISRLPAGILTDKFGGKWVMGLGTFIEAILALMSPIALKLNKQCFQNIKQCLLLCF